MPTLEVLINTLEMYVYSVRKRDPKIVSWIVMIKQAQCSRHIEYTFTSLYFKPNALDDNNNSKNSFMHIFTFSVVSYQKR